jgi:molybdate transport system regulatory protein
LEAIGETGSIAGAGRRMGMSYRRACVLAKTMTACFREPLIDAVKAAAVPASPRWDRRSCPSTGR